ncbi:MAG: MBL fold metallo-hydrolase [Planctomycetota bacterium]|nr:MBL fold metallo-hydrolase [Planctomycetota bacterium]
MDVRVISIGTLATHPLWDERPVAGRKSVRAGHATTTLIRAGDAVILVDPSLPPEIIASRLNERSGLRPRDVTHVFLTSFKPDCRRGVHAFEDATWWISSEEREQVGVPLLLRLKQEASLDSDEGEGDGAADSELMEALRADAGVLQRCQPPPDSLTRGVDLFPLPGVTPGTCGLLISLPRATLLVCGDAVATTEHLERGQILPGAVNVDQAMASFREAIEIADVLIPGRDNVTINPTRRPF